MANSPQLRVNSIPRYQPLVHQFNLQIPQSCADSSAKIANIRRHIAAAEKLHQELMSIQDKIEFGNKGIVVTGLIRDTCVAFLDLAASILPDRNPAQGTARIASASVGIGDSLGEILSGNANWSTIGIRTVDNINSAVQGKSAGAQLAQLKIRQVTDMAPAAVSAAQRDTAKAKAEAQQGAVNTAFDTVSGVIAMGSTAADDNYSSISRSLSGVKAAYTYNVAVASRLDTYLQDQTDVAAARAGYVQSYRQQIAKLTNDLRAALSEFERCAV